jgi:hypothetical protein
MNKLLIPTLISPQGSFNTEIPVQHRSVPLLPDYFSVYQRYRTIGTFANAYRDIATSAE